MAMNDSKTQSGFDHQGGPTRTRKKWGRRLLKGLLVGIALFYLGDLGYSLYVANQIARWERNVERDASGVLLEGAPYSVGEGKDAVLFVHGINESPHAWRFMAPKFAESGFHCRVMRLPGFAEPVDRYAASSIADWTSAVAGELAALHEDHDRVFVVAHSLGGAIALNVMLNDPDCCDGAVFLAPLIKVSDARSPLVSTRAWHRFGSLMMFTRVLATPFKNDAQDPAAQDPNGRTLFTPRSVVSQTFELADMNRNRSSELKLPVLLVVSPTDHVIDSEAAVRYFEDRRGTRTEVFWLATANHAIPYDYGWETVVARACGFLRSLSQTSESP
jgi:alpha-beta hydrolase superfamily lysophospholipase